MLSHTIAKVHQRCRSITLQPPQVMTSHKTLLFNMCNDQLAPSSLIEQHFSIITLFVPVSIAASADGLIGVAVSCCWLSSFSQPQRSVFEPQKLTVSNICNRPRLHRTRFSLSRNLAVLMLLEHDKGEEPRHTGIYLCLCFWCLNTHTYTHTH